MTEQQAYEKFISYYETGDAPWDDELPPPEVIEWAATLPPGRALDLGCGYGRTAVYLAKRGWQVDGVDFIPQAIDEARRRATVAGVAEHINYYVESVVDLSFLSGKYQLVVDVGCLHNLTATQAAQSRDTLLPLLEPDALLLWFSRLRDAENSAADPLQRMSETAVRSLFSGHLTLASYEEGATKTPQGDVWRSAWFVYRAGMR